MADLQYYIFIFIILEFIVSIGTSEESVEYYCKKTDEYKICRTCPNITSDCETAKKCQCDNIELKFKGALRGGSDCTLKDQCFVSSTSPCEDKVPFPPAESFDNLWHKNDIWISKMACNSDNRKEFDTGSKPLMIGVKITEDYQKGSNGYDNATVPYETYFDTYQECQKECTSRCKCGAWSFDDLEGICYLHNIDSCCDQTRKQQEDSSFISGYVCPHCSSTKYDCPCGLQERLKTCSGSHNSAKEPDFTGSAGLLGVHEVHSNADPCACEKRLFKKRNKCRCVQQQCFNETLNPNGTDDGCTNKRRCRETELDPVKFPPC